MSNQAKKNNVKITSKKYSLGLGQILGHRNADMYLRDNFYRGKSLLESWVTTFIPN